MPQHPGKKKPNRTKKKKGLTILGLSVANVTGPVLIGNPIGRVHKPGQLFAKTRKPA